MAGPYNIPGANKSSIHPGLLNYFFRFSSYQLEIPHDVGWCLSNAYINKILYSRGRTCFYRFLHRGKINSFEQFFLFGRRMRYTQKLNKNIRGRNVFFKGESIKWIAGNDFAPRREPVFRTLSYQGFYGDSPLN